MTIKEQKKFIRNQILSQRSQIDKQIKQSWDNYICETLWTMITIEDLRNIHCFLPTEEEINLYPLLEKIMDSGRTIICPKTVGKRQMEHLVLQSFEETQTDSYGVKYPTNTHLFEGVYDLIIVPGLAYDNQNNRIGYGGAFYDTFLARQTETTKIGVAYPFQIIDNVPIEAHDIKVDNVLHH